MSASGTLAVTAIPVARLDPALVERLWALYAAYYDHVSRDVFERDLREKAFVFVGRDTGSGEVVGFSTAIIYMHEYRGRRCGVYFSGDTVIDPRYWGQKALHMAAVRALAAWKLRHPFRRLYWLLICSGYRTYLTLARNFPEHWPHFSRGLPLWEGGLIDSIAGARFGPLWRSDRGVVSANGPQPVLKPWVAPFTADVLALPEVRFFVQANPGYLEGDELAVIGRVSAGMVLAQAVKWVRYYTRRLRLAPAAGPGLDALRPGRPR